MRGVNLIPAQRLATSARRALVQAWIVGGAVYLALIITACVALRTTADVPAPATEELEVARAKVSELQVAITTAQNDLQQAEYRLSAVRLVSDEPDWSILMALVGKLTGEQVVIRELRLTQHGKSPSASSDMAERSFVLKLRGYGQSQPAVSQLVLRLQETRLFKEVKLHRMGREPFLSGATTTFELECLLH